jgi:hypothetical protein
MKEVPVEVITQKNNKDKLLITKNMENVQIALKKWNEAYIKCFVPSTREARYHELKKIRDNSYNIENNFWEIIKNLSDEENYHNLVNEEELARQEAINAIRKRARFDGTKERLIVPNLSGLNFSKFNERLLNERRLEFVGEGQRWFDLVRFNQLESAVKAAKSKAIPMAFHKLFPIPQEEVDLNNNLLPQNPGY